MKRQFTGFDMTRILVAGFGVVIAVNFLMASLAVSGFGGVVVDNSYVASQKFNGWLEQAERSRALGWQARIDRDASGRLVIETSGVPAGAIASAELRRPLGAREYADLTFPPVDGTGVLRSNETLAPGRWTVRLTIASGDLRYSEEMPLP